MVTAKQMNREISAELALWFEVRAGGFADQSYCDEQIAALTAQRMCDHQIEPGQKCAKCGYQWTGRFEFKD